MSSKHTINIKGEIIDLSLPKVMGIINVTPDSFFIDSRKSVVSDVLERAEQMLDDGATFLDIGGYSSRPGAEDISVEEELKRVIDPIGVLVKRFPEAIISIDTFRSEVARKAIDAGASMVNDISGGQLDTSMLVSIAEMNIPYIAMHMRGTPQTMKNLTDYEDPLNEIVKYLSSVIYDCNRLGIKDVIIDPGFGFAKTAEQSFEILSKLDHFHRLDKPILVGLSRKSMIYRTLNLTAEEALNGTSVLNSIALLKGASILRVHDVKEAAEAIKLISKLS
ncbi:dihydropteroate synthase [Ekhidna sp.]|uniref:dihydropteroate synthase n=1 Tax=Ekhidna sp. TaxID=2608089 RepID=UPI003BAAF7D2